MPAADEHGEARLLQDPRVAALQPVIEPAHGLVPPLHLRLRVRVVGERVRPGADHRLHRRLQVLQHARHAVAVAVVPAADHERRHADRVVALLERGALPERAVALLALVREHPRRRVEAVLEIFLVDRVVGRAGHEVGEVLAHLPGVDVHHAVHEVHVVLVEVIGRVHGDDRAERGRVAHRHVDGVEAAPRDAEHADLAGREALLREPVDHDFAVRLLDVRIFVRDQPPLAVAGPADVDTRDHVAAANEVGVETPVAVSGLGLAIGQVFEQHREALAGAASRGHEQVGREPHAVGQRDPGFLQLHLVGRWGRLRWPGRARRSGMGSARDETSDGERRCDTDAQAHPRPPLGVYAHTLIAGARRRQRSMRAGA